VADIVFVALIAGFFALAVGLVKVCERIVGPVDRATADLDHRRLDEIEVKV
jgi:hypothetical protein